MSIVALWSSDEAISATAGRNDASWHANGISIDTRTLAPGDLFVALDGDNRDGHQFVNDAFARGAAAALVHRRVEDAKGPLLEVKNTLEGLRDLARAARRRTKAKCVAVTGSVGKTGTKEALRLAFSVLGATHASAESYNNHWGVPLSLARMPVDTTYGIFEIGMNHVGEIAPLAELVKPNAAIITTVEPVHLAHFSSVEAIAEEKGDVFGWLAVGGSAIINRDNAYFPLLRAKAERFAAARVFGFGEHPESDARLITYAPTATGAHVTAIVYGHPVAYDLGVPGKHIAINSLAVLCAVLALGGDIDKAAKALARLQPPKGRGGRTEIAMAGGAFVLVDESYNANPASMRAAISLLGTADVPVRGRKIAVLGDMLELGPDAPAFHAGLADAIEAAGVDQVFTAGPLMEHLFNALASGRRGAHASDAAGLSAIVGNAVQPGDVVMVKGSFGSRMGVVVEALRALAVAKDGV